MSPAPSSRAVGPDVVGEPLAPAAGPGVAGAGAEGAGARVGAALETLPEQEAARQQPDRAGDDEQDAEGAETAPDEPW